MILRSVTQVMNSTLIAAPGAVVNIEPPAISHLRWKQQKSGLWSGKQKRRYLEWKIALPKGMIPDHIAFF